MSRRRIALYVAMALILPLLGGGYAIFDIWQESTFFVKTTDARVGGTVLAATAPVSGRVVEVHAGIGQTVQRGDVLASISAIPSGRGGLVRLSPALSRYLVHVRSPVGGTVLKRMVDVGATVRQGETLYAVGDLQHLWIVANIEETRIGRVQPGQTVDVTIEAIDKTLIGEVLEITPATLEVLGAGSRTGGGAGARGVVRAVPSVPVRVAVNTDDVVLYPGMSAEVKIHVQ